MPRHEAKRITLAKPKRLSPDELVQLHKLMADRVERAGPRCRLKSRPKLLGRLPARNSTLRKKLHQLWRNFGIAAKPTSAIGETEHVRRQPEATRPRSGRHSIRRLTRLMTNSCVFSNGRYRSPNL